MGICDIKTTWKHQISCEEHIRLQGSTQHY
jgi:hypothetical protein